MGYSIFFVRWTEGNERRVIQLPFTNSTPRLIIQFPTIMRCTHLFGFEGETQDRNQVLFWLMNRALKRQETWAICHARDSSLHLCFVFCLVNLIRFRKLNSIFFNNSLWILSPVWCLRHKTKIKKNIHIYIWVLVVNAQNFFEFQKQFSKCFWLFFFGIWFGLLGCCAGHTTVGQDIRMRTARFQFKSQAKYPSVDLNVQPKTSTNQSPNTHSTNADAAYE